MAKMSKYRSKLGPIPEDHFENEPGPPGPPVLPPEELADFDQETQRLKSAAQRIRARRQPAAVKQP